MYFRTGPEGRWRTALVVDPGDEHVCAVLDDHSVKCWGMNRSGQAGHALGNLGEDPGTMGDKLPTVALSTGRTAVDVSAGSTHTCAVLDDDTIKCWENGSYLGLESAMYHGGINGDMGDALPAVKPGAGAKAQGVATSVQVTCALLVGGAVKCWGQGATGVVAMDGLIGDDAGEMGDNLPALDFGTDGTSLDLTLGGYGPEVGCAILEGERPKCWGDNFHGQLGQGDTIQRGLGDPLGGDSLPPIDL